MKMRIWKWSFSPYDEYALEAALQLKESSGGELVAITAGPARCEKLLRDAAAVGADTLVHVSVENINDLDSNSGTGSSRSSNPEIWRFSYFLWKTSRRY